MSRTILDPAFAWAAAMRTAVAHDAAGPTGSVPQGAYRRPAAVMTRGRRVR